MISATRFYLLVFITWLFSLSSVLATSEEPTKPTLRLPATLSANGGPLLSLPTEWVDSVANRPTTTAGNSTPETMAWPAATVRTASALFLATLADTKGRLAERTRYLASEALSYGIVVSNAAQSERDTAAAMFGYLDSRQQYVDQLSLQDLTVLPVGMKTQLASGNGQLEIGILKATFLPDRALLSVFVRLKLPSPDPNSSIKERELFFGADEVVFSRDGGLLGDFKLVLLGDFIQPMGNMTLRIKGGLTRFQSPDIAAMTYATVSCGGLAGIGIVADVLFPRSMLVPIDATSGQVQTTGQVMGGFKLTAPSFDDIIIENMSMTPFAVTGYEKFGFVINRVALDLSDIRNPSTVVFPSGYFSKPGNETPGGEVSQWRGVYIGQFSILLPPEFKETKTSTSRLSINARDMLFDRNGVTGNVGMSGQLYALTASGWKMTLNGFELGFEKNKLTGGRFGGYLYLPIANQSPVIYNAIIDNGANYKLSLTTPSALSIPLWRAQLVLAPSSTVNLAVINGNFKPQAILHGQMGIFCTLKGQGADSVNARIKFKGIVFQNLKLQTEAPYLTASYFGYEDQTKLAGFPVTVSRIAVVFPSATQAGLNLQLSVNLMEGKFGGTADFTILGEINTANEIHEWNFKEIKLSGICVDGTISNVTLQGCVQVFDGDATYGDGFGGKINLGIKEISKTKEIKVEVAGLFGAKTFRYWFVSGGVYFTPGIPIVPPLDLTGIYASAYHNMSPVVPGAGQRNPGILTQLFASSTAGSSPLANIIYKPDQSISLGFKGVVSLQAIKDNVFKGTAGMEMTFNQSGGLNTVGFYGEGQLIGKVTDLVGLPSALSKGYEGVAGIPASSTNSLANSTLSKLSVDTKASKAYSVLKEANASISARLSLLYDYPNRTFDGNASVNIAIGNFMTGSGWMKMHFDPNQWYVYVNDPTDRAQSIIDFGIKARTQAYFMVGHNIPTIPAPPAQITSQLRNWRPTLSRSSADIETLKTGNGIIFGASTQMRYDISLLKIVYFNADAGAGFDIMMRSNTGCNANALYARGQAYAWLQLDAGVKVPIYGQRSLINAGTAVLMQGGFPNPAWLKGDITLHLKFMGFINADVNFDLTLGTVCGQ